jgi:hypothetical protein
MSPGRKRDGVYRRHGITYFIWREIWIRSSTDSEIFPGETYGEAIFARARTRCSSRVSFGITTMWTLSQCDGRRFDYENGRDLVVVCRVRPRVGSTATAPGTAGIRQKGIGVHVRRCCRGGADIAGRFE